MDVNHHCRWNVGLSLAGLASAFLLPQGYRMTFNAPWNGQPAFPLGWNVSVHCMQKSYG